MAHLLTRALLVAGMATAAASAGAYDWQDMVFVSSTMGNHAGRLCASGADATKLSDIGCPTYAPSLTTAGDVSVTGAVQATRFLGDGSGLTGLSASSDRITSGTSSIIVSQSGAISFTTAGTERMVVTSAGNVGIGTTAPAMLFDVSGTSRLRSDTTVGGLIIQSGATYPSTYGSKDILLKQGSKIYGTWDGNSSYYSGSILP